MNRARIGSRVARWFTRRLAAMAAMGDGERLDAWQRSSTYRWGTVLLLFAYALTVCTGLAWFISPSPSVDRVLDPAWSLVWSLLFVVAGSVAFVSRLRNEVAVESFAQFVIAAALLFWGGLVLVVVALNITEPPGVRPPAGLGGLQTAAAFFTSAVYRVAWATITLSWSRRTQSELDRLVPLVTQAVQRKVDSGDDA